MSKLVISAHKPSVDFITKLIHSNMCVTHNINKEYCLAFKSINKACMIADQSSVLDTKIKSLYE